MPEHYQRTIDPGPHQQNQGADAPRSPSRQAVAGLIHQSGLDAAERNVLFALLDLHWPASLAADERPGVEWVKLRLPDLKVTAGLNRVPARDALRALARHGYIELVEYSHRGPDVRPIWGKLVGVGSGKDRTGSPDSGESGYGAEASGLKVGGLRRPPELEASESGGLQNRRPPDLEASGDFSEASSREAEASDEPDEVALAVLRVGNHLANVLREGFAQLERAVVAAIAEASGGLRRPPDSEASKVLEASGNSPYIHECMNHVLKHDSFMNGGNSAPAEASEVEASAGGAERDRRDSRDQRDLRPAFGSWPGWPAHLADIRPDKLDNPDFVQQLYEFAKGAGFWQHAGDDRLLFFATVIESLVIGRAKGKKPGGILTNKVRRRDSLPASVESIDKARASLEQLAKRGRLHPARADPPSALDIAMESKRREMRALPEPVSVGALAAALGSVGGAAVGSSIDQAGEV